MYFNLTPLILASQSPRRKELLESLGISFEVIPSDFDEDSVTESRPEALVRSLAGFKARAVALEHPEKWVLAADTVVAVDDRILGKPGSPGQAIEMVASLSGRTHSVWGGIALVHEATGVMHVKSSHTEVTFSSLSARLIEEYCFPKT